MFCKDFIAFLVVKIEGGSGSHNLGCFWWVWQAKIAKKEPVRIDYCDQARKAYRIQGTDVKAEVWRLTAAIGSAKGRRRNIVSKEYQADYFRYRPTKDVKKQNNGHKEKEYVKLVV